MALSEQQTLQYESLRMAIWKGASDFPDRAGIIAMLLADLMRDMDLTTFDCDATHDLTETRLFIAAAAGEAGMRLKVSVEAIWDQFLEDERSIKEPAWKGRTDENDARIDGYRHKY